MIYFISNQQEICCGEEVYKIGTVEQCLSYFKDIEFIGFDTETEGFDPHTKKVLLAQFGDYENQFVVDTTTVDLALFKELLESKTILMQNAKFDLRFLYHYRIVPNKIIDTYLNEAVAYCGDNSVRKGLDVLAMKYCGVQLDKSIRGAIHKGINSKVIKYAADDVKYLEKIAREQDKILQERGLYRAAYMDNDFVKTLAYIEYCGFKLDVELWNKKMSQDKEDLENALSALNNWVIRKADEDDIFKKYMQNQLDLFSSERKCRINWNSEKQVIPLMEDLGLDLNVKDKKTGHWKKSVEAGILLKQKHEFIPIYLNYKAKEKVRSTYGESFLKLVNKKTGRIHGSFRQIMNTGRLSSGGESVNFQNVPAPPEERPEGRVYERECFVADNGNTLLISDYTGQESVVFANKCKDPALIEFYEKGLSDMHSFIASKIYPELEGLDLGEIKKQHKDKRQKAKAAGFAIQYGGNGQTIANNLNMSSEEGEKVYNAYFDAFTGVKSYFQKVNNAAIQRGYILFNEVTHRKSYFDFFDEYTALGSKIDRGFWEKYRKAKEEQSPEFDAMKDLVRKYFMYKGTIERRSYNYPIQGSSADITKIAGIYYFNHLKEKGLLFKVKIVNTIHDEYVVEVPLELVEQEKDALEKAMAKSGDLFCDIVPLKAEAEVSPHWKK